MPAVISAWRRLLYQSPNQNASSRAIIAAKAQAMPIPAFAPVERPREPALLEDVFEGLFSEGTVEAVGVFVVLVLICVEVFRVLSDVPGWVTGATGAVVRDGVGAMVGVVEVYRRKCFSMVWITRTWELLFLPLHLLHFHGSLYSPRCWLRP
jgi:hypothetical protein